MLKLLISIIVPVYNEEENVDIAYAEIKKQFANQDTFNHEIIFMDNASSDQTFKKLSEIADRDRQVRVIRLARNFGFQRSIMTGYSYAQGDAAIQIDCDLEDPPSVFPELIKLWESGHDVVIGLRSKRKENFYLIFLRRLFYKFLNQISETTHLIDAGDFRLIDRSILNKIKVINDNRPYVRGLVSELAKNQIGVHYERNKRQFGKSKFPLKKLFQMAVESIYTTSTLPLRIATYLGILIAVIAILMSIFYIYLKLFHSEKFIPGFTTTTLLILFGISLNSLFLGIIGEYLGRIYNQVRKSSPVIVAETINLRL